MAAAWLSCCDSPLTCSACVAELFPARAEPAGCDEDQWPWLHPEAAASLFLSLCVFVSIVHKGEWGRRCPGKAARSYKCVVKLNWTLLKWPSSLESVWTTSGASISAATVVWTVTPPWFIDLFKSCMSALCCTNPSSWSGSLNLAFHNWIWTEWLDLINHQAETRVSVQICK